MATASASPAPARRTAVYVDGFNLYYGSVKGTPYKWLDLGRLCSLLLPGDQIVYLKYFTAEIHSPAGRSGRPDSAAALSEGLEDHSEPGDRAWPFPLECRSLAPR